MDQPRDQWTSRAGFVLAAAGSAIGLGNLWKFPYITWENRGGEQHGSGDSSNSELHWCSLWCIIDFSLNIKIESINFHVSFGIASQLLGEAFKV